MLGICSEFTQNLLGLGSTWNGRNLLGMVGIWSEWSEFGRNESEHLAGFSLKIHSYQIPTIPSGSAQNAWLRVKYSVFEIKEMGCLSPFESSWVSTAPVAYFKASVSIWKGLVWSGIIRTGSSVNRFFNSSKAF